VSGTGALPANPPVVSDSAHANIEFKAHCRDRAKAREVLTSMGASALGARDQIDTYFSVPGGRLKYREDPLVGSKLIAYRRPDDPTARISQFEMAFLDEPSQGLLLDTLRLALTESNRVEKKREVYVGAGWLANLDTFKGYDFIEVEVEIGSIRDTEAAREQADELRSRLGISPVDVLPWSYEQLGRLLDSAFRWRSQLGGSLRRMTLIDGASGAGKSTIVARLRSDPMVADASAYVRRCTSRPRRHNEVSDDEYIFLPLEDFREAADTGQFLEYKDFLFNMSYGLRWVDVREALNRSPTAFGLANLGNIGYVERFVPEVTTILVDVKLSQLKTRLEARGVHDKDALAERIQNAELAHESRHLYDVVVDNNDGQLDEAISVVKGILLDKGRRG
jgi:adenylate cyclase class 2